MTLSSGNKDFPPNLPSPPEFRYYYCTKNVDSDLFVFSSNYFQNNFATQFLGMDWYIKLKSYFSSIYDSFQLMMQRISCNKNFNENFFCGILSHYWGKVSQANGFNPEGVCYRWPVQLWTAPTDLWWTSRPSVNLEDNSWSFILTWLTCSLQLCLLLTDLSTLTYNFSGLLQLWTLLSRCLLIFYC